MELECRPKDLYLPGLLHHLFHILQRGEEALARSCPPGKTSSMEGSALFFRRNCWLISETHTLSCTALFYHTQAQPFPLLRNKVAVVSKASPKEIHSRWIKRSFGSDTLRFPHRALISCSGAYIHHLLTTLICRTRLGDNPQRSLLYGHDTVFLGFLYKQAMSQEGGHSYSYLRLARFPCQIDGATVDQVAGLQRAQSATRAVKTCAPRPDLIQ